jgi:hypothetical protein
VSAGNPYGRFLAAPNARRWAVSTPRIEQAHEGMQQGKAALAHPPVYRPTHSGVMAPPVYRPNARLPLQRKPAVTAPRDRAGTVARTAAPPVHQPTVAKPLPQKPTIAPPRIYRTASITATRPVLQPTSPTTAKSVQLMENPNNFGELLSLAGVDLKSQRHEKTPTLVMTSSLDSDNEKRYKVSRQMYKDLSCRIVNKGNIIYDTEKKASNIDVDAVHKQIGNPVEGKKRPAFLVVTGHGNLQWLFGATPGSEGTEIKKFAQYLKELERSLNIKLETIVLDNCWSAAELKEPVEGIPNHSPARILSKNLGQGYLVFGFNGKAAEGKVEFATDEGERIFASYYQNAIIFHNGQVVKGSGGHPTPGQGVPHTTKLINTEKHKLYKRMFGSKKPALYRTNSFSSVPQFRGRENL